MRTMLLAIGLTAVATTAAGQSVPAWYPWHNGVAPTVTLTDVTLNATTGEFTYSYSLANGTTATQSLESVYLELAVAPTAMGAPADWQVMLPGEPGVAVWFAGGEIDPTWTEAHGGDLPRYLSNIAPGASLPGFTLRSRCAAAGPITYHARGYNTFPAIPEDDTTSWLVLPTWREDAVAGSVGGPGDCGVVADWGNRRPGVDGFVGLVNFAADAALPAGPVTVQLRFARAGETVNRATLHVELNGTDMTSAFVNNATGDAVAVFARGSSPLRSGRNVLLVSVQGTVTGSTRTATDADRFSFTVP